YVRWGLVAVALGAVVFGIWHHWLYEPGDDRLEARLSLHKATVRSEPDAKEKPADPPAVAVTVEIRNRSKEDVEIYPAGGEVELLLEGPGVSRHEKTPIQGPKSIKLKPGEIYRQSLGNLAAHLAYQDVSWDGNDPGEYTLTVIWHGGS